MSKDAWAAVFLLGCASCWSAMALRIGGVSASLSDEPSMWLLAIGCAAIVAASRRIR